MTTAIVLAGGLGTRLRQAVPDLPKPLAPVAGRPFLAWLLDRWAAQGIERFVLSVGYRAEAIREAIGARHAGVPVAYSVETEPLGTGGALLRAAAGLSRNERFLLLNGDTWFDVPLAELAACAVRHDTDWCLSLFCTEDGVRYMGPRLAADGRLLALSDPDAQGPRWANGGVYLVHPRSLRPAAAGPSGPSGPSGPVSLEADLLPQWLAQGARFAGHASSAPFIDIGVPQDWRRAASIVAPHLIDTEQIGHA
jgi:D-glycero-alpha-D-manno-heptose 1-phosphate guanylyltransferase